MMSNMFYSLSVIWTIYCAFINSLSFLSLTACDTYEMSLKDQCEHSMSLFVGIWIEYDQLIIFRWPSAFASNNTVNSYSVLLVFNYLCFVPKCLFESLNYELNGYWIKLYVTRVLLEHADLQIRTKHITLSIIC